jgi:CheY-like chemotaxis protein
MKPLPIGDFAKPNILLAEDNEMNVLVITKFLNRWNIYPEVAQDGQEAVNMASIKVYDLILMDLMMPNLSGPEAVQIIRNQGGLNAQTPILALSARPEAEVTELVRTSGFTNYVNKPFMPQDLFDKLSTYLPTKPEAPIA